MDINELEQDFNYIKDSNEAYKSVWEKYNSAQTQQATTVQLSFNELSVLLALVNNFSDDLQYISYKCDLNDKNPAAYVMYRMDELVRHCPITDEELKEELISLYRIRDGY